MAPRLRTLLVILAVGALVGACSSGDDDASDDRPAPASGADVADGEVLVAEPCGVVGRDDLSQVTGLRFDAATPSLNTCVYTSSESRSAVAVNFRSIGDRTPEEVLERSQDTCEEGTVQVLEPARSEGSFGCIVGGVPTVVATGGGLAALLTGSPLNGDVDPAPILQELARVVDRALQARLDDRPES